MGMDYLQDSPESEPKSNGTGAGNNPSTWAGAIVIGAVLVLAAARRSFRRFM